MQIKERSNGFFLLMKELQKSQNKLLRTLTGEKASDRIKIADKLTSLQMMSVNQIAAQIKLTDMWKALNDFQYPLSVEKKIRNRRWGWYKKHD
jgi:hypothetical protein